MKLMSRALRTLFVASLLQTGTARAGLTWEATERTPPVSLHAEKVEVAFPFKNDGPGAVTILSVRASCGCTVPTLAKQVFAPGETGKIEATFQVGERVGDQHSVIYVLTDVPGAEPLQLHLRLNIPQPLEVEPRVVSWSQGEEPAPKTIEVRVHPEARFVVTGIGTTDGGYLASVRPQPGPGRYLVEIRPVETTSKSRAVFRLQTDQPLAKPVPVFAFVR